MRRKEGKLAFERHGRFRPGSFAGMFWFAGWLFTLAYAQLLLVAGHFGLGHLALLFGRAFALDPCPNFQNQTLPEALTFGCYNVVNLYR